MKKEPMANSSQRHIRSFSVKSLCEGEGGAIFRQKKRAHVQFIQSSAYFNFADAI